MKEDEIREKVHALANRLTELSAELARLQRRKEFEQELRERGSWLADGNTKAPPWVERWNEYWERLRADPRYVALVSEYESVRAELHSPEFESAIEGMKTGDGAGAEYAVAYIEADPWYFRSGYFKATLARRLRRIRLTPEQQRRLRTAILASLPRGARYDWVEMRKLARRIETPVFREELERLSKVPDPGTSRRAALMLEFCRMNDTPGRDLRGAR
ncbi:MAG: hypothetical protein AB7N24_18750 [Dehalococcoidia bacterium]